MSARRWAAGIVCVATALGLGASCGGDDDDGAFSDDAGTDGALPPLEDVAPPLVAPEARRDAVSSSVVFDAERGRVWTANGDVGSVAFVDVEAFRRVDEIAIGGDIRSVALSPDARWIAAVDRDGARVALVDAESRTVRRVLTTPSHPRGAIWDAANPRYLYVALEDDAAVGVVDRTLGVWVGEIPVARLPVGLAVSRLRREIVVTHRIDGFVTIIDAEARSVVATVPISEQPADPDPKVPQGKPFAFDSVAWAPSGVELWTPHQLFAPTHPFQFQSTVFPAVSVLDLRERHEIETDPVSGVVAGRKLLFDAIDLPDSVGNASIVSQPCAAAVHPNGFVAYVVACGSEDLLVFDVLAGRAIDLVRDLPGDHPSGIALDDHGDRAFVVADQSHTLSVFDLAGGSVVKRVRLLGEGAEQSAIPLAASDPLDPETREGLKLFYGANSDKGPLATTGNHWMACGSCHLDGLVGTNEFFFEAAKVADATADAQIGHVGLADLFSTAPTPDDPSFNPHDVLVAFTDQGGLAPDRNGESRTGAIDPAAPTDDARRMARRVARVIARDLPVGPSWLLGSGTQQPDPSYDAAECGSCHAREYSAWQKSAHAHAGEDPMVRFGAGVEAKARGAQYTRLCAGCHDPVSARLGDTSLSSGRGITCLGCHDVTRVLRAGGNADLDARRYDWKADHATRAHVSLKTLRSPEFCGGCHQQFVPGTGVEAIATLREWQVGPFGSGAPGAGPSPAGPSPAAKTTSCVDCHMPLDAEGHADHSAVGGNVYLATHFGHGDQAETSRGNLRTRIALEPVRIAGGSDIKITVRNRGIGHSFPTGVSDVREPWVELQAVDGQGKVLAHYGGPDAEGRLGMDIAKPDGTVLLLHELSETTRIPFSRRVPAGGALDLAIPGPAALPSGAVGLDAVLLYRNVRTPYLRAATGDANALAPETEMARARVP